MVEFKRILRQLKDVLEQIDMRLKPLYTRIWHYTRPVAKLLFFPSTHNSQKIRWLINATKIIVDIIIFSVLFVWLVYVGAFGRMPNYRELSKISNHNASEVYSSDGVLMGRYYVENRVSIGNEDISKHVINALIATEDSRFFEHSGIDFISIARVMCRTVLMADLSQGGGSTISQQLAKNLYPRKALGPFTYPVAKVKEIMIAHRLENIYSKEQILTLYLNTVPFGENVYGIEAASKLFFSRKSKWLEPHIAATLVGMLAANTAYNPRLNPEKSLTRRNVVLSRMAQMGYLDSTELNTYKNKPLELNYNRIDKNSGLAPHFRDMVCQEVKTILNEKYGDQYDIYSDGLKIVTTINSRMQDYAETAVRKHMTIVQAAFDKQWSNKSPWDKSPDVFTNAIKRTPRYAALSKAGKSEDEIMHVMMVPTEMTIYTAEGAKAVTMSPIDSLRHVMMTLNAGFIAVHPQSGKVLAWVGGVDHRASQYDHVTTRRQVGSTFKPIVYSAALMDGMEPTTYIENVRRTYAEGWSPSNADGKYGGFYSLKGALSKSLNTASAWIINEIGPSRVVSLAHRMGIESNIPAVPSIALGTAEISLCEMATAYTTFPNYGAAAQIQTIVSISDHDGNLLYSAPANQHGDYAITTDVASYMIDMMEAVVDSGTARSLRSYAHGQIAGKTGTTQNGSDGWFICFTPNLVAGAWVGGEVPIIRFKSSYFGQGAYMALPIVGRFINRVQSDRLTSNYTSSTFKEVNEDMAINMCYPMYLDSMQSNESLLNMAVDKFMGNDTIKQSLTEIPESANDKPIRNLFRRLFGNKD